MTQSASSDFFQDMPAEQPSIEMAGLQFSKPENLMAAEKKEKAVRKEIPQPFESLNFDQIAETIRDFRRGGKIMGEGMKSDFIVSADPSTRYGIKHLARPEQVGAHEARTFQEEANLQQTAMFAGDEWVKANLAERQAKAAGEPVAALPIARVPEPYAYISDPSDPYPNGAPRQYMVMEIIQGKTLSRLIYEESLRTLLDRPENVDLRAQVAVDELSDLSEKALMSILSGMRAFEGLSPTQISRKLYEVVRGRGIVTEDQVRRVQRLVQAMNGKGLFHRDLHERNLIVNQATGDVAVIDFGTAVFEPANVGLPRAEQLDQVFTVPSENAVLPVDQDIATIMTNLTDRPISGPAIAR